ncbi:MAG: T9SS type A sorting domain-containing protein [Bacteroidota bacterium]
MQKKLHFVVFLVSLFCSNNLLATSVEPLQRKSKASYLFASKLFNTNEISDHTTTTLADTLITCEDLGLTLDFQVCVVDNETGITEKINICELFAAGVPIPSIDLCEPLDFGDLVGLDSLLGGEVFNLIDSFGCDALPFFHIPVCITNEDSTQTTFFSPCAAFDEGFSVADLLGCEPIFTDTFPDNTNIAECPEFGFDFPIDICVISDEGEEVPFPLCEAFYLGLPFDQFEICTAALDSLDCDPMGIDFPVCVADEAGNEVTYPSPCAALQAGVALQDFFSCQRPVDSTFNNLTCEALGFYFDFTVCIAVDGGSEELLFCDALAANVNLDSVSICESTLASITADNCDVFGLDLGVCFTNDVGDTKEFESPCAAIAAGVPASALDFCEDAMQEAMARLLSTNTEELPLPVEVISLYPNPVTETLTTELTVSENMYYQLSILTLNGAVVYQRQFRAISGTNVQTVDVSSLSAGVYLVQLQTANEVVSRKLVKR